MSTGWRDGSGVWLTKTSFLDLWWREDTSTVEYCRSVNIDTIEVDCD